jgi:long-chain fatty acid transport protein
MPRSRVLAWLVAGALVTLATLAPRSAHASPEDIFGYGPRSPAMGGTGTAHAEGFDAAYTNPALLSRLRARKLTLGFQGATFQLHADGPGLPGRLAYDPAKGIIIGVDLPIPFGGALKDRVGVGMAFYTPTQILVRGRILYAEEPQYPLLPDRTQSLAARIGLGLDLGYGFRAGAGFAVLAEIAGDVIVATDATGRVGSRVEDQLVATYAPIFGLTHEGPIGKRGRDSTGKTLPGQKPDVLRVGAVFRGTLDARFSVAIDGTKLSSLNIPIFNISGVAQYDPMQAQVEAALEHGPWTFAIGATYKRWSAYPGLVEPTIRCPEDAPDCGALQPKNPKLSDTLVPRAGVERKLELTRAMGARLRAGYSLEPTPVPDALPASEAYDRAARETVPVANRFFDGTRHIFGFGGGIVLTDPLPPLSLDLYGQVHWLPERTVDTGIGPDGVARIHGTVLVVGMLAGVSF